MSAQPLPLAASVLLLREATAAGAPFELYMLRRPERARPGSAGREGPSTKRLAPSTGGGALALGASAGEAAIK